MRNGRAGAVRSAILAAQAADSTLPARSRDSHVSAGRVDATHNPKKESEREYLVHRHALRQVPREVRVDAPQQGQFIGEELQGQHR